MFVIFLNFKFSSAYFLGGLDECDSTALIYQCGQREAPNLVSNAIAAVELNASHVHLHLIKYKNAL
jgi:hypothetical protein